MFISADDERRTGDSDLKMLFKKADTEYRLFLWPFSICLYRGRKRLGGIYGLLEVSCVEVQRLR